MNWQTIQISPLRTAYLPPPPIIHLHAMWGILNDSRGQKAGRTSDNGSHPVSINRGQERVIQIAFPSSPCLIPTNHWTSTQMRLCGEIISCSMKAPKQQLEYKTISYKVCSLWVCGLPRELNTNEVFCVIVIVGLRASRERNTTFHSTFSPLFVISVSNTFSFDNITENSVSYFYWATFTSQHGLTTGSAHNLNYINNIIVFSHET